MDAVNGINSSFFGMHLQNIENDKPVGYGSIRLWDTGTTWRDIETQKGKFDWTRLDQFVQQAVTNGNEIVYTLGQPPLWATTPKVPSQSSHYNPYPPNNIKDWKDYVTAVTKRYRGKIKYYEIWNEPNLAMFYAGTIQGLVQLTKEASAIIHQSDSTAKVLSPCYTGLEGYQGFDAFLAAGGKFFIDIIAVHLYCYPSQPERMISLTQSYRKVAANHQIGHLPIWNTESSWNNFYYQGIYYPSGANNDATPIMPDDLATSYLFRMFLSNWVAGIERCFFYGMDSMWSSIRLLTPDNKSLSLVGYAYKRMVGWFDGAVMNNYEITDEGMHSITFTKDDHKGYCVWTTDLEKIYGINVPADWAIVNITRANGDVISGVPTFYVDKMPVLLDSVQMNRLLPTFKEMDDNNSLPSLAYNSDFKLYFDGTNVPSSWSAGAMPTTAYAGTDVPLGYNPITLAPTTQYQGLRQAINNGLLPGARYEMAILYKLPAVSMDGEWMLRIEVGSRGTLLEQSWGASSNTDQNDETGSGINLNVQNEFAIKKSVFLYDLVNQMAPSGSIVQFGLINRAASGQNKPIHVAGIWLRQITQVNPQESPSRIFYLQTAPKSGSFGKGDQIIFTNPDTTRMEGYSWICSVSGTLGTINNVMGTIQAGAAILTISSPDAIRVNNRIMIGSDTTVYTVSLRRSSTQFELNAQTAVTQTNQTVTYAQPDFIKLTVPRNDISPTVPAINASPYLLANTNGYSVEVVVAGGAVTKIEFSRDGFNFFDLGMTSGSLSLSPKDQLRISYSVKPTVTLIPR
ncbi:hypothetical protein Back11_31780 [Paenibacillus baekrokdamisoli]|uniref:Uncharacterized protein n=1 Tax=Paenibacillus baekrokdamisoli TaxID=1712516 RepID=A0A3G9JAC1_9BACL|nr:hypothetical protein [Paenibacillus baekrokdamisoli]MBB3071657.1 hypothetical protein [Paenibacillus baekrokdamisoli]BBH21833.1 hypothetical protein Back11_31780 [Paenibacillus baekrokdamisoli]